MRRFHRMLGTAIASIPLLLPGLAAAGPDEELDLHVTKLLPQLKDVSLTVTERERMALQLAGTLDRAAQSAKTAERQRSRWKEAREVLDQFHAANPNRPQGRLFVFQSAVYQWAESQSWARQAELNPGQTGPRDRAMEGLEGAVAKLRPLEKALGPAKDPFAQNVRYRLARALADHADISPQDKPATRAERVEALSLLDKPFEEKALQAFLPSLKSELLLSLDRLDEAQASLDAARKAAPPLPVADAIELQTSIFLARKQFDRALTEIKAATVDEPLRAWLTIRVLLARWRQTPQGPARLAVESELFQRVESLRKSGKPEARMALSELARTVEEPAADAQPEAFDALAEGELLRGRLDRAGALVETGAKRAEALKRPEQAAALRFRAGAMLIQASQFEKADRVLTRVMDDPKAGPLRPKAGLLRIMARGKLSTIAPGDPTRSAYVSALEAQIRDFPKDPGSGEARWLLGQVRMAAGEPERAISLWMEIPQGNPRWIDSRLACVEVLQKKLDERRIGGNHREIRLQFEEAESFLDELQPAANPDLEVAELQLKRIRLNLTPDVGRTDAALLSAGMLARESRNAEIRARARRLLIVAQAQSSRYVEAERGAREEINLSKPIELLPITQLLDDTASSTDSDLVRRRFGHLLRILIAPILAQKDSLTPAQLLEVQLRQTRALIFSGDHFAARKSLINWSFDPKTVDERWLEDLADTYVRLGADPLAIDAYRYLIKRRKPGSPGWFAAKYGLALSYSHAGKNPDARLLVDGTAILYPDMGGGLLRSKFEALRQRIAH